ncbi:D-ribose pyranase [Luteibacter sp. Sphag1AF]|uniref:D-ribose pyranase n=1 Tax=Luteibacter sp. Sphag1AF TaxID=2587031 RepID=UPI00161C9D93|nr:D-ribose pyranase [Luteibacter sp. Sphag1AF]
MKRHGLQHAELNRVIATMGHTDTLVIGDVGLPVPPGVPCIDLAVVQGTPSFQIVFDAVFAELAVESVTFASEIHEHNPEIAKLAEKLSNMRVKVDEVSHDEFKRFTARAVAVVRTGEASPYSNVILHAGVTF